jgi:hypothetical protein
MSRKILNGIDANNQRITSVGTGVSPSDAINLAQLQSAINGLSWHGAVRAASTGNVTIATPGAAIDGVTLATGNRVLLKNQTTATENGVYVFNGASSPLTRAADGVQGTLNAGAAFYVDEGTVNADTSYTLTTDDPITVGTTSLAFGKFSGGGIAYTAGLGLLLSGTQFSVDFSKIAQKLAFNVGDGSSSSITVTHNLATLDVMVQLVLVSTGETIETDTVRINANSVQFTFPSPPPSNGYRALISG